MFDRKIVLEKGKRFSESVLWQYQMRYFEQEGVNAWSGQVPYFITSNPHIVETYAHNILCYYADLIDLQQVDLAKPLYIIELGTGSGKFSFYLLQRLQQLRDRYLPHAAKLCYVMTDFTESNLKFWQQQPQLQPFVAAGLLDFSQFNMITDHQLHLSESGKTLTQQDFTHGMVILGNYIFDTVPHDAFYVKDQQLYESRCFVDCKKSNLDKMQPKDLSKLNVHFKHQAVKAPYDDYNPALQQVMQFYVEHLQEGSLLVPITGLRTLDNLNQLANGQTLVLSSDKGYSSLAEIEGRSDPSVVFHQSFSMMVNFHAMALYNQYCGGDSFVPACHPGLRSIALVRGHQFDQLPKLAANLDDSFAGFNAAEYFHVHSFLRHEPIQLSLTTIIGHLAMSHWDPHTFRILISRISKTLHEVPTAQLEVLDQGMKKLDNKFYYMPNQEDLKFDIGFYFHMRQNYELALQYYQQSLNLFGPKYSTYYNAGICYFETAQFQQAVTAFQHALSIDCKQPEAQKWLDRARLASRV